MARPEGVLEDDARHLQGVERERGWEAGTGAVGNGHAQSGQVQGMRSKRAIKEHAADPDAATRIARDNAHERERARQRDEERGPGRHWYDPEMGSQWVYGPVEEECDVR